MSVASPIIHRTQGKSERWGEVGVANGQANNVLKSLGFKN